MSHDLFAISKNEVLDNHQFEQSWWGTWCFNSLYVDSILTGCSVLFSLMPDKQSATILSSLTLTIDQFNVL